MLSGFVIGYAYDDRWKTNLTLGNFIKRRLIRLHPMVVLGALFGAICFLLQGSVQWNGTHIPVSTVMVALLCALFFIPVVPGANWDVRGNTEAFPLNGPAWSLFFEYIGNLLYALFIHRLSTRALTWLVVLLGIGLTAFTWFDMSGYGNLGVGWSMYDGGFGSGLLRMLFPFSMGLLLSRHFKPAKIKGAFWICSAILLALFIVPHIGSEGKICLNGVYESFCIIVMFPILVWTGASGQYHRPIVYTYLQISRRHFLPTLYHPLSGYVPFLCLAHQTSVFHPGRNLAGSHRRMPRKYIAGLCMPQDI